MRLNIQFGPGFNAELWSWKVRLARAASGRVEAVWETSTHAPERQREHRFRARDMPDWWTTVHAALDDIAFERLPPAKEWTVVMDGPERLEVEYETEAGHRCFSVFFAPAHWPVLPDSTRLGLVQIVATLDPLARCLHAS